MRAPLALLAVAALVATALVTWARPAQAAAGCASRAEWRHVHHGQTVRQVRRTVGARGVLVRARWGAAQTAVLTFRHCGTRYGEAIAYLETTDINRAPLRLTQKDMTR